MTSEETNTQETGHTASEEKKLHKKKSQKKSGKSKTGKKKTHAKTHQDPPGFLDDIEMNREPVPLENDPFAPRDGKALLWRNINMTLVRLFSQRICFIVVY